MKVSHTIITATALAGLLSLTTLAGAAEPSSTGDTIKPVSGEGASPNAQYLHNGKVGPKQAVSYFQNESGLCKLTLMVGEAFDGEDVPDMTTVSFQTLVNPGHSVRFRTAEGKALEYACETNAGSMRIRAFDEVAAY